MSEDHPEAITSHCVWQLTRGQYSRLVGDSSSEHDGWEVEMMIYTGACPYYQWWIFRGAVIYIGASPPYRWRFLSGWCFTLRHSQFVSLRGLWWIRSCRMTLHWGIATSESTFIGDTVTLLDTLHCDTLYSLMVDFWDDDLFWGIAFSSVMDFDFSLEHSHFRWFTLGHSHLIHIHRARGFLFVWIMLRYYHFWQWDLRLIDLLTYTLAWSSSAVVDSDTLLYTGA